MMHENVFIAWSGNKDLADELGKLFENNARLRAVVGGGIPTDMFIGEQVLDQISRCSYAILLVEDKNGHISPNLMFEWGYIMAKLTIKDVHAFLINKAPADLPSDLLGTWVSEISYDRTRDSIEDVAQKIYNIFNNNTQNTNDRNYFDLINNWKKVYVAFSDEKFYSSQEICENVLSGCLAAYYYQDNQALRWLLDNISIPEEINPVIVFAKAYIDVFINSDNMTKTLPQEEFFNGMHIFEMTITRKRNLSEKLDLLLDILNYDVYGLSCILFLKNKELDPDTVNFCSEKAKECFNKALQLIDTFEEMSAVNVCLIQLLRGYLHNDIAHLYRDFCDDENAFLQHLATAVEQRKSLWQTFVAQYPRNFFLSTKLEQEYMIALSEQCRYMEDSFIKTMYKKTILSKFKEWEKDLIYTSSLTDRLKANINNFQKKNIILLKKFTGANASVNFLKNTDRILTEQMGEEIKNSVEERNNGIKEAV